MNGYKAFYKGKEMDVYADTQGAAHDKAVVAFKAKKSYDVHVHLCEKDCPAPGVQGTQVVHTADV